MKRKNKKQRKLRKCEKGIKTKSRFYQQRDKAEKSISLSTKELLTKLLNKTKGT